MTSSLRTEPDQATPDEEKSRSGWRGLPTLGVERFSGLYLMALLVLIYSFWIPDTFLTSTTIRSIASDQAIIAILALALIVPLAAGAFDLSVAAQLGFSVALIAWLQGHGWNAVLSVVVTVLTGAAIGAVNGMIVTRLHVSSFIATLGMSSILLAGAFWITNGRTIVSGFSAQFLEAGRKQPFGIPLPVFYLLGVALILWYVLEYTPIGRYFYASGANPVASRLAGLQVDRLIFQSLVISGGLAALAGVILTAKLGVASPDVGSPYLLPAFSAAFLGSTQIRPGRVNVLGTLVAVYLLAIGVKGLELGGSPPYVDDLFNGVALITAVALAARTSRRT
ncbi:MAG: ribose transport system permease protein [Frankiales bacterium]|jgi:ribose transport system permease protein|nr:ribose transport system permease protein [Frankiales bacterium]